MATEERAVTLRYLDVSDLKADILFSTDEDKVRALEVLGIAPLEDEKPIAAWCRAMSEENGFEYTVPTCRELSYAILENRQASAFMWFLA